MSETQLDTVKHSGEGNTKISSPRSRAWCFTLNNYTKNDITFFTDTLNTAKYAFQEEVGESGTPHLQGLIYFDNARTFAQMKQIHSKAHWEKTKCCKNSLVYCTDISKRAPNGNVYIKGWEIEEPLDLLKPEDFKPWHNVFLDILKQKPEKRVIYWIFDPIGDSGKTEIAKYVFNVYKNKCFYCTGGKASDIINQVLEMNNNPFLFLMDLPRCIEGKISYNALEQVKNGFVNCGKYKGGTKIFNTPHVFVFANWLPDIHKFSLDRWRIFEMQQDLSIKSIPVESLIQTETLDY